MTSPGDLFSELWVIVEPRTNDLIAGPWLGKLAPEFRELRALLISEGNGDVPSIIRDYLSGSDVPFDCFVSGAAERAFVVMSALDEIAGEIHPGFAKRLPGRPRPTSGLLSAMKQKRTIDGAYSTTADALVVPKGHLEERKRPDESAASGIDLVHQFTYLTRVKQPGAGKRVKMVIPSPTKFLVDQSRADSVGVAPIAEDRNDLSFEVSKRGNRPYLDAKPNGVDLHGRIERAVIELIDGGAGLILLPELVSPTDSSARLAASLRARAFAGSALVVAGTGLSAEISPGSGRPYNEAVIMTAQGDILGVQKKLHPFNMGAGRMQNCSIVPEPGFDGQSHMEDVTGGDELLILELHGLGRVMLLICEDLEQQTPCGDIALVMRPDWILTPVLDVGQDAGRWTHGRAIEIGRKTWSRVVISNSGILGVRHAETDTSRAAQPNNTAVCLDAAEGNRVLFVPAYAAAGPQLTLVSWAPKTWQTNRTILVDPN